MSIATWLTKNDKRKLNVQSKQNMKNNIVWNILIAYQLPVIYRTNKYT